MDSPSRLLGLCALVVILVVGAPCAVVGAADVPESIVKPEFGFSVTRPVGWKAAKEAAGILLTLVRPDPSPNGRAEATLRVYRKTVPESQPLQSSVDAWAKMSGGRFSRSTLRPPVPHSLGGKDGLLVAGTASAAGFEFAQRAVVVRHGKHVYLVEVMIPSAMSKKALADVAALEKSWQWLETAGQDAAPAGPQATPGPTSAAKDGTAATPPRTRTPAATTRRAAPTVVAERAPAPPAGFKLLESEDYGVRVHYPEKWKPLGPELFPPGAAFVLYPDRVLFEPGGIAENLMLVVERPKPTKGGALTLKNKADELVQEMRKQYDQFTMVREEDVQVGGEPARRFVAEFEAGQSLTRWNVTVVVRGDKVYHFIYQADARDYDKWAAAAVEAVESARWTSPAAPAKPAQGPAPAPAQPATGDGLE